ncbi:hypothetical protein JG688_00003211 [Phytophthora aleatoria]|uniref:CCHC-type domain-containing protein n=1 Tax=Phytophthora aleatoria TaxID=2496075 RepID=A0A8J5MHK5_9STRA|nr:hypothetical protein JG688_00003211 [Phytophthora aleatoria]
MLVFPREFFLICICSVYALAFASIRTQVRGLYGENGIEPVDVYLRSVKLNYAPESHDASTFAWIPAWRTAGPLTLLWIFYLSIVKCGQTFMQFQWDSFLLEVGVLALLLAPWWHRSNTDEIFETPAAAVWTLRFLFFKFMLMSGAVKIQSRCPTWLELTALDFHFATQSLPLPLSWYALQAPPIINRLAVAVTLLIEGPWTLFLIAPHPTLRRIGAIQQIALQISILLTGNYNFFNLLTIILAAALLDSDSGATDCDIDPTSSQRVSWISRVESAWHTFQTHRLVMKASAASVWVFTSSVVTLSVLDQSFQQSLPSFVISTYYSTEKYRITSAYGLFRTMTGVGTVQLGNGQHVSVVARPEIILEGTKDGGLTWKAYHFKYKPDDRSVARTPRGQTPGSSHDVKRLLDTIRDPFPDSPPHAIRAQLYYYDFTRLNTSWNQALPTAKILDNSSDPQWWTRTFVRKYLPALERENPSLTAFVEHHWPSSVSKLSPETSEVSASELRQWINQVLEWLCSEPWSPVGLAELRESRKCHHCGQSGHLRRDCPDDSGPSEDKCYQCGETGHWARNCPGAKA